MTPPLKPLPPHRHAEALERLRAAVLEGPGHTEATLRQAIAGYAAQMWGGDEPEVEIPSDLRPYIHKVTLSAYKVTDRDVEALKAAGYSEDEILEATLACAVGCGMRALEVGLAATGAREG